MLKATKKFSFSKSINKDDLPGYIKHYILDDEPVLAAYKTSRDFGIFSDKKVVLFDRHNKLLSDKQIQTIPYNSIATIGVIFGKSKAKFSLFLQYGHTINLIFSDLDSEDKVRLRILYTCINRVISNQTPQIESFNKLLKNNFTAEMKIINKQ